MEWKSRLQERNQQNRSLTQRFQIKAWRDGRLYYSINKKGAVKTGSVQIIPRFAIESGFIENKLVAAFSAILLSASVLLTLALFAGQQNGYKLANPEPGIGGIGSVEAAMEEGAHDSEHAHKKYDSPDEALKDKLLGAEPMNQINFEDAELVKRNYRVKSGDTLSEIAKRYNVSVESIAGSSNIKLLDRLQIGQVLSIPSKEGFFYSVQKNDRLGLILKKYKVSYEKFIAENPAVALDLLEVGQEIFLPDAKPDNLVRSWLVPVASRIVTSSYGWRTSPRKAFHKGLDLKAAYATVRAAKGGRVTYAGWLNGYGKVVIIAHPGGYKTLYAHLSAIYVKAGASVAQGSVIAKSGNTGYSTGPHLHFEVTYKGKHVNPATILVGLRYKR